MIISATVTNKAQTNIIGVATEGNPKQISIPAKADGKGSSINGGELLFLALATCFCNDVYREGAKRQLTIRSVEVSVTGKFGGEGEPGSDIQYQATVDADATAQEINELIAYVDTVAEIHNTLRLGATVTLTRNNDGNQQH